MNGFGLMGMTCLRRSVSEEDGGGEEGGGLRWTWRNFRFHYFECLGLQPRCCALRCGVSRQSCARLKMLAGGDGWWSQISKARTHKF